jgi:hypothetical protein
VKFCKLFSSRSVATRTSLKIRSVSSLLLLSHLYLVFQFRVQDTCYELLFRIAAFGLDKKSALFFIVELDKNGILQGSIDWPHTFLPGHRRQHKKQIPNATTVKWTCSHLIKHLHLLKIIVHSLGQFGLLNVNPYPEMSKPASNPILVRALRLTLFSGQRRFAKAF